MKREQTQHFLLGLAIPGYVHASKPTKLEDFTIQASQGFKFFTIDFQGVNKPLQPIDYLSISSLKCFSHLCTHKFDKKIKITTKELSFTLDMQTIAQ